jgi:predicted AAA+ superfamily ATPase
MIERLLDLTNILDKKSIFIFGPRQTGKTTFLKYKYPNAIYLNLLNTQLQLELLNEPYRLNQIIEASEDKALVIVDEIQKAPILLDEIQNIIQENNSLRFILTGSSARKIKKAGINLLGGRAKIISFAPFTYPEYTQAKISLIQVLQWGTLPPVILSDDPKSELIDYIDVYLREEIKAEALVRSIAQFSKFLELAATTVSEQIVYDSLCSDVGVSAPTIKEYFQILEDTLIGHRLYPYSKTTKRKAMASPKFYFFDVGIGNALLKRFSLHEKTSEFGTACEQYVFQEISAYIKQNNKLISFYYWRSYDKHEVDFVVELEDEQVVLVEVKSSKKINSKHLSGINAFCEEKSINVYKKIIVCFESTKRLIPKSIIVYPFVAFLKDLWENRII